VLVGLNCRIYSQFYQFPMHPIRFYQICTPWNTCRTHLHFTPYFYFYSSTRVCSALTTSTVPTQPTVCHIRITPWSTVLRRGTWIFQLTCWMTAHSRPWTAGCAATFCLTSGRSLHIICWASCLGLELTVRTSGFEWCHVRVLLTGRASWILLVFWRITPYLVGRFPPF